MLHTDSAARERILLIGPWGSGKSYAACTIATWLRRTKAESRVCIIDTNDAYDRMAEEFGEQFFSNVTKVVADEFPAYMRALQQFSAGARKDDWLVVDMIDEAWERAQDYFMEETIAKGKPVDQFMLEYRRGSEANPLNEEGGWGINWLVIKRMYAAFMRHVTRWPGHVLACTPGEPVRRPDNRGQGGDSQEVLELYGRFGIKPRGEKSLGHQFHSLLLLTQRGDGWVMSTARDRGGREQLRGAQLNDFVHDYLVAVGGWELA